MAKRKIKVVPFEQTTGRMTYNIISYLGDEPESLGNMQDMELAEQVAVFLEAFTNGKVDVPSRMTTQEFHDVLVNLGLFNPTSSRATMYARMSKLGLTPVKRVGRTAYYSKRQLTAVVQGKLPQAFNQMAAAVTEFGRIYSLIKRSIT